MSWIRGAVARFGSWFRGGAGVDEDLRRELETHLEMEIEAHVRAGMDAASARRRALLSAGGMVQAAESVRAQRGLPWLEGLFADVRFALRQFGRTRLTTLTMVLVLSIGLGTNVVVFTMLNSLATMPAPGIERDASRVWIRGIVKGEARLLSWPEVQQYTARAEVFSDVAAYADGSAVVAIGEATSAPLTAGVTYTTPNYFDLLGVRPTLGRVRSEGAVISHALWQTHFGSARDVIGRTIRVNDFPVEIAAVAPPRFVGPERNSPLVVWLPLETYPLLEDRSAAVFSGADTLFLAAVARLAPGVTPAVATQAVARTSADVVPMLASNNRVSMRRDLLVSATMSGGFGLLVLLITCTNVSVLLVGLAVTRRREIGVRLSLGAPRMRVIRQLLTESVLLSFTAASIGLVLTVIGVQWVGNALRSVQLVVDWRVTIGTFGVALLAGILFGISPALHATRVSLSDVLKTSARSVASTRSRLQRALVVTQVAVTQPLLVGVGVLVFSALSELSTQATSPVADRLVEVQLDTWAGRVSNAERNTRIAALVERVGALPGVTAALPMQLGTVNMPVTVHAEDRVAGGADGTRMEASFAAAPRGYFEAFEIPIVRGRNFDAAEYANTTDDPTQLMTVTAVIIGSDLARKLWGDADPVGRRLVGPGAAASEMTVVGVIDEHAAGGTITNDRVRVYAPYSQMYTGVIARTEGPATPLLGTIRKVVAAEAPQMPILRVETMAQREAELARRMIKASSMVAVGGLLALFLSAIGLYAVVSFSVGQRTHEIGVRTALGAHSAQVVRMFFLRGVGLCAIGLAIGLPLSMVLARMLVAALSWPLASPELIGLAIGAMVLLVAAAAAWIPARRASSIDPIVALRTE